MELKLIMNKKWNPPVFCIVPSDERVRGKVRENLLSECLLRGLWDLLGPVSLLVDVYPGLPRKGLLALLAQRCSSFQQTHKQHTLPQCTAQARSLRSLCRHLAQIETWDFSLESISRKPFFFFCNFWHWFENLFPSSWLGIVSSFWHLGFMWHLCNDLSGLLVREEAVGQMHVTMWWFPPVPFMFVIWFFSAVVNGLK